MPYLMAPSLQQLLLLNFSEQRRVDRIEPTSLWLSPIHTNFPAKPISIYIKDRNQ